MDDEQGFDPDLFIKPEKLQELELICPICECVIKDAVETPCGHLFCNACINRCLQKQKNCPIDRKDLTEADIHRSIRVDRVVGQQQVHCSLQDDGCAWIGQFSDMETHSNKKCEYAQVSCEHKGCEEKARRKELAEHETKLCGYRPYECPDCKEKLIYKQAEEHKLTCIAAPVECSNHCKTDGITRNTLQHHLLTTCPARLVPCPYLLSGCDVKVKLGELEKHLTESVQNHLHLTSTALLATKAIVQTQKAEMDELKQQFQEMRGEVLYNKLRIMAFEMTETHSTIGEEQESLESAQTLQFNFQKAYDHYGNLRYSAAIPILLVLAAKGHSDAQHLLAQCYLYGRGVTASRLLAAKWFARSAAQGHVASLNALAAGFNGSLVPSPWEKNMQLAAQLFHQATELGSGSAAFNLGLCYRDGEGVPKSEEKAQHYFTAAVALGNRRAQTLLKREKDKDEPDKKDQDKDKKEVEKEKEKKERVELAEEDLFPQPDKKDKKDDDPGYGVKSALFKSVSALFRSDEKDKKKPILETAPVPAVKQIVFGDRLKAYNEFNNGSMVGEFMIDGKIWPSTEHYFQAQKFISKPEIVEKIRQLKTAKDAFLAGRQSENLQHMRRDWNETKEKVMFKANREKFNQNPKLKELLLSTGESELVRNDDSDPFWGDGRDGRGLNMLGKTLMAVREELVKK